MTRGGKVLLLSGCLAATGCGTDHGVQVRAIGDTSVKPQSSSGLLGEARAQLAMGAVGLAIESFRTLQRQQPDNVDAYAGLAASYAAMGRYDLTRTNYEIALAYAPNDPALLQALAVTLDKLGETEQAAQVRNEVRSAAAKASARSTAQASVTPLGVPRTASMTVKLPDSSRAPLLAREPEVLIARPRLGAAKVELNQRVLRVAVKSIPAVYPDVAVEREVQIAAPTLGITKVELARAALPTIKARAPNISPDFAVTRGVSISAAPPSMPTVELAQSAALALKRRALSVSAEFSRPADTARPTDDTFPQAAPKIAENVMRLPAAATDLHVAREPALTARPLEAEPALALTQGRDLRAAAEGRNLAVPTLVAARIPTGDSARKEKPETSGPYLERTSLREVALITVARPVQQERLQPRAPRLPEFASLTPPTADRPPNVPRPRQLLAAAALRWVPLRYASSPQNIALLNAARADGLAARTRVALVDRGWRKIAIGNAQAMRQHSVVFYAPGRMRVAARLAAQFRCKAVKVASIKSVVVLLGRDAVHNHAIASRA